MEAIGNMFGIFHNLSLVIIVLLVMVTLAVSAMMIGVFRGDFDGRNSQF